MMAIETPGHTNRMMGSRLPPCETREPSNTSPRRDDRIMQLHYGREARAPRTLITPDFLTFPAFNGLVSELENYRP